MYKITWSLQKIAYAIGGALASFIYDIQSAMTGLLLCITADTITGLIAAPYRGQKRNSSALRKVVPKMITYLGAGILAHICEMLIMPSWIDGKLELGRIVFSIFSAIEIMSCFENMRDITGLRAFDILTLNFKKQIEDKIGVELSDKNNDNK